MFLVSLSIFAWFLRERERESVKFEHVGTLSVKRWPTWIYIAGRSCSNHLESLCDIGPFRWNVWVTSVRPQSSPAWNTRFDVFRLRRGENRAATWRAHAFHRRQAPARLGRTRSAPGSLFCGAVEELRDVLRGGCGPFPQTWQDLTGTRKMIYPGVGFGSFGCSTSTWMIDPIVANSFQISHWTC